MTQDLHIHDITPETSEWTCKVQIIDICGPKESKEKGVRYFNMIAQDDREDRVKLIVYGDDIPAYQERMELYHSYRITKGRLQLPYLKNKKPVHTFNWVLDRKNIIDPIEKDDIDALPLPTKIDVTSFQEIKEYILQSTMSDANINEFDILAVVVNCSSPRYIASAEKRIQELIVMDISKQTLTFTIWEEEIIEREGNDLLHHFREYPVILARRVGASKYNGVSLTTKFNTTIQIDPPYPQRQQLQNWVTENQEILASLTRRSTTRSEFLIDVPINEEIVPIAGIESQQDGQTFSLEAAISFSTNPKNLYVLVCANCGQEIRYPTIREIDCMNCDQRSMLIPRCKLELHLQDSSGSTTSLIMDKEAEKDKYAPMQDIQASFTSKLFSIRAKKAFARTSRTTSIKIYIQSCVEKQNSTHYVATSSTQEGGKRKQQMEPPELGQQTESLKMKQKLEPDTPQKQY